MKDPFVEEIRRIRRELDRMDPKEREADLQAIRERYKDRLVTLPPKRIPGTLKSASTRTSRPPKSRSSTGSR